MFMCYSPSLKYLIHSGYNPSELNYKCKVRLSNSLLVTLNAYPKCFIFSTFFPNSFLDKFKLRDFRFFIVFSPSTKNFRAFSPVPNEFPYKFKLRIFKLAILFNPSPRYFKFSLYFAILLNLNDKPRFCRFLWYSNICFMYFKSVLFSPI